MKHYVNFSFKMSITLLFIACGGNTTIENNSTIESNEETSHHKSDIMGLVQKGTFIDGNISVYKVEKSGRLSNLHINSTIDSNGSYELALKEDGLIALHAKGKFFNEYTGKNSTGEVKLYALVDYKKSDVVQNINLNLFTSLEYQRVLTLIKEGKSYLKALASTRISMKKEFGLEKNTTVTKLNIYNLNGTEKDSNLNLVLLSGAFLKSIYENSTASKTIQYQKTFSANDFEQFLKEFSNDGRMDGAVWKKMKHYDMPTLLKRINSSLDLKVTLPKTPFIWTNSDSQSQTVEISTNTDDDTINETPVENIPHEKTPTPTVALDLQEASDSGLYNDDNITNARNLLFDVPCPKKNMLIKFYAAEYLIDGRNHTCQGKGLETVSLVSFQSSGFIYRLRYKYQAEGQEESDFSPALRLNVDRFRPQTPTIATPITGANISGTAEAGTELTAHTATSSCTTTVDSSKNYSCTLSPAPMNGETLEVVVEDIAGNVSHKATATIAMIDVSQNVLKTGVVTSIVDEDDGYYKKGQDRSYAYTDNVNSHNTHTEMILDNQTGLIWQNNKNVTANDYASLSGATNWDKANTYCENLTLDAYDDWRLPSIQELLTLIDYSKQKPSVNSMFTNIEGVVGYPDYHYYWSSTELASNNVFAHLIDLKTGEFHYHGKSSGDNVKCVRGNSLKEHQFAKIQEGVVKDLSTNLVWQDDEIYDSTSISDAISYCQNLHLGDIDDWRVPNMNELASILDLNKTPLNISNVFENTSKTLYYSSTHSSIDNTKYWLFGYETSSGTYSDRTQSNYKTRCVSGTNPPTVPTVKLSVLDNSDTDEDNNHIKLGIALNGTTFSDENVLLIQLTRTPNKDISASAGFVYVDETHAYIVENMENIREDTTVSFTVDNSEIDYSKNITSNSIVIQKPTPVEIVLEDVVTVGNLMWEDTNHTRVAKQTWNDANNYCSNLTLGEYVNWRLPAFTWEEPAINEMGLIMSDSDSSATVGDRVINEPFTLITVDDNIVSWTAKNLDGAHIAGFFTGGSNNFDSMSDNSLLNVRCVRDIE